jgi:hypothetical protein
MKSNKKAVTIAVSVLVLIAIIFCVYYFFIRDDKAKSGAKLVEMTVPGNTQNITGNIDEVKIESSMFKDVLKIRGWAFKQNVKEKSREMYLVFKSGNSTLVYDLENDNAARPDVTKYFNMTGGADNHGFEAYIPVKELRDSTYRIGFMIRDESGQYFSMSQKEIAFSNGSVQLNNSKFVDNRVSIPLQAGTAKIKYYFDKFAVSGNTLDINGWAFLEGMSTDSLKTYVVLKSVKTTAVFSVVVFPRKDVTNHFKETRLNLDACGFSCKIEGGDLEKGKYEVCLYLVNENQAGLSCSGKFAEIGK